MKRTETKATVASPLLPVAERVEENAAGLTANLPLKEFVANADSKVDEPPHADYETFLPIHGFVWFSKEEWTIIDHPAFQRLGRIHQLGQAHLLFRGATHMRFEHVLGSVHVAQKIIDAISSNYTKHKRLADMGDLCKWSQPFSPIEQAFIRLSTLLHDIGHIVAGHTLEDELHLLPNHDKIHRLKLVFDRKMWPGYESPGDGPTMRELVDRLYKGYLIDADISASELVFQIIAKDAEKTTKVPSNLRIEACRDVVGNTICADFLDYLYRDWHHIGKTKECDHRIFQYMEIREDPKKGHAEFVISLGESQRLRTDAITAIVNLLESRYQLAETALFHRTKSKAAAMLERALLELSESQPKEKRAAWLTQLEEDLLDQSDWSALIYLYDRSKSCPAAKLILRSLINRNLYKDISTTFYRDIVPETSVLKLRNTYSDPENPAVVENRLNAVRNLESDFELDPGSLVIYCPAHGMNAKIPGVSIHLDGTIETYADWNKEFGNTLDAGQISAQIKRFEKLWRVQLFLHPTIFAGWTDQLKTKFHEVVKDLMLDLRISAKVPRDETARQLAQSLTSIEGSPHQSKQIEFAEAARRHPTKTYLFGAPCLKTFYRQLE